jgi:hypothetical protein
MLTAKSFTLSEQAILGLFYIQRYRFLTIDQFTRAAAYNKRPTASDQLRILEHRGLLGYFGNTGKVGYGKTPKVYFLTRKGWEILTRESDIPSEMIGRYKEVRVESRWSPQMYHRLHTVDLLLAAELSVRGRPHLTMVRTFLEYITYKTGLENCPRNCRLCGRGGNHRKQDSTGCRLYHRKH